MPSANQIHGVAAASGEHLSRFWLNQARFSELKQPVSAGGDPDCPKSERLPDRDNDCVLVRVVPPWLVELYENTGGDPRLG